MADDGIEVTGSLEFLQPVEKLIPTADRTKRVEAKGVIQPEDLHIFLTEAILRDVIQWSNTDTYHELGGVFVGDFYSYKGVRWVDIVGYVKARHYQHTAASFKFTHDSWSAISRECEEKWGDRPRVGWHHTHPGYGIFLSGYDQFIHFNFFNVPGMFALVVDPKAESLGFFQLKKGKIAQCGFFFVR
jgi:proteasome lid subunit RPN8/RPN11